MVYSTKDITYLLLEVELTEVGLVVGEGVQMDQLDGMDHGDDSDVG